jgi:hypothetical protein
MERGIMMENFVRVLPMFSATLESLSLSSNSYMEAITFSEYLQDHLLKEFSGLESSTIAMALPKVTASALHDFDLLSRTFPTLVPIATLQRICFF